MSDQLVSARETDLFRPEHVFYSRTDERGLIQSANSVFQEISGYSWQDLIGAPHKIVRHPGMPRAAFELLWQRIQDGQPVGFYAVNRCKGGEAYTVFAVAMPFEGGYISVRLKPMSDRVAQIKELYDMLAKREASEGLSPADSLLVLRKEIRDMGFAGYEAFMADMLEAEVMARGDALGKLKPRDVASLSAIQSAVETVARAGRDLEQLLQQTKQIPDNMRLQATRLEGRDGPIGVISANYQIMTDSFSTSLHSFLQAAEAAVAPIRTAKFLSATGGLVADVAAQLKADTGLSEDKKAEDLLALARLSEHFEDKTANAVKEVAKRAEFFNRGSKDMRRMVFGLEMTRTMCNIERSKRASDTEALDGVVERLKNAELELSALMTDVEGAVYDIRDRAAHLMRDKRVQMDPPAQEAPIAAE